ncbi:MAG: ATP-binding protein [bacterium]|nr:ATP-binding protein [bacterium]
MGKRSWLMPAGSIRNKILMPFFLITVFMTFSAMFVSLDYIDRNLQSQLRQQLNEQLHSLNNELAIVRAKADALSGLIKHRYQDGLNLEHPTGLKVVSGLTKSIFPNTNATVLPLEQINTQFRIATTKLNQDGIVLPQYDLGTEAPHSISFVMPVPGVSPARFIVVPLQHALSESTSFLPESDVLLVTNDSNGKFITLFTRHAGSQFAESPTAFNGLLAAQDESGRSFFETRVNRDGYRVLAAPISEYGGIFGVIALPSKAIEKTKTTIYLGVVVVLVTLNLGIILLYVLIVKRITDSLGELSRVAKQVANGDLYQEVSVSTRDEIGQLAHTFNQMIENMRNATEDILTEKNRSEAIVSNLPEGIIITDSNNELVFANQRAEEMLNFSNDRARGKTILEYIKNEDFLSSLKEQLEGIESHITREVAIPKGSNKNEVYLITSSLAKNEFGHSVGVITIIRDVTQEKELQELRDSFLRNVSHELRTPLTSVIGFLELLHRGKVGELTAQQQEYLGIALTNTKNLKNLINDLLDLSVIKARKYKMLYGSVKVSELFDKLSLIYSPLADAKNLAISFKSEPKELVLDADPEKLTRILENLISNALKFTPEGRIEIACSKVADNDNLIAFRVTDTGIGLKPEEYKIIFDKFRQADASSTRGYEGIGLGLSIVQELVRLHKGTIALESTYQTGSTFTFTLPADKPAVFF